MNPMTATSQTKHPLDEIMELTDGPVWTMEITQPNGLVTKLRLDRNFHRYTLETDTVALHWDKETLLREPESYLRRQGESQQKYLKLIRGELATEYEDLHTTLEREKDLDRSFQLFSENSANRTVQLCKYLTAPLFWLRGTTAKKVHLQRVSYCVEDTVSALIVHKVLSSAQEVYEDTENYEDGEKLDGQLSLEAKKGLRECRHGLKDLQYFYARLIDTAKKKTANAVRMHNLFYPQEKI